MQQQQKEASKEVQRADIFQRIVKKQQLEVIDNQVVQAQKEVGRLDQTI